MGRERKHVDPLRPLPLGLFKHRRQYRARRPGQPWQYFGTDYVAALTAFGAWKQNGAKDGTVSWWLNICISRIWPDRVKAKDLAPRTLTDYTADSEVLKDMLGHIPLHLLAPHHIAKFRDARGKEAPVHVRNEMGCLASALTAAVEDGQVPTNVARQVERPSKGVRDRLIRDDEYLIVHKRAIPSVRLAMTLAVRTLGLPADVLRMGPRNIVKHDDGRRTLAFARGKTGVKVEIEIVGELAEALQPFIDNPTAHPTFVRKRNGKSYSVTGIGAMFRRYCVGTQKRPANPVIADFGLRDLRAKGATEMYRAGVDIRKIQRLLGHKSVQTTEIYLKQLLAEIVRPNERPIIAEVAK